MNRLLALLKMNIKLLLRNRAFVFFVCVSPLAAAIVLNLKTETTFQQETKAIYELSTVQKKAIYNGNTEKFIIKVYDGAKTELSEYLLEELAASGMFSICRADVQKMSKKEVEKQAQKDAFDDRAGALLYLQKEFDEAMMQRMYENAMQIYDVSDDSRWEIMETEISSVLSQIAALTETGMDSETIAETLQKAAKELPAKEIVTVSGKDNIALTKDQATDRAKIGYALAMLTLGFIFCGVCVAHTVIEEQDNKVYTRCLLTRMKQGEYLLAKYFMMIVIALVQTGVLGIYMFFAKNMDFGINKWVFLANIFLLGLIFSSLSFVLGTLLGDIMSANSAVLSVWCISALLAGLYFPLETSSPVIKALSNLMPQKWFLKASEMLIVGDNKAYSMILCITAAYLIVIISIGVAGLRIKRVEA